MWQKATKDTKIVRVRARIKTRAVEPQALQDHDELRRGKGTMGALAASSRCKGRQLDLKSKKALPINQARRTAPSWMTEQSTEGWPPCAFGLENLTHLHVSRVADRVLVLRPGVRYEPLRWESRVQDIGPPETRGPT